MSLRLDLPWTRPCPSGAAVRQARSEDESHAHDDIQPSGEGKGWSGRRVSNPRHSAWKAGGRAGDKCRFNLRGNLDAVKVAGSARVDAVGTEDRQAKPPWVRRGRAGAARGPPPRRPRRTEADAPAAKAPVRGGGGARRTTCRRYSRGVAARGSAGSPGAGVSSRPGPRRYHRSRVVPSATRYPALTAAARSRVVVGAVRPVTFR